MYACCEFAEKLVLNVDVKAFWYKRNFVFHKYLKPFFLNLITVLKFLQKHMFNRLLSIGNLLKMQALKTPDIQIYKKKLVRRTPLIKFLDLPNQI